jgi:hypothetical protein
MMVDTKPKRRAEANELAADDQPAAKRQVDGTSEETMPSSDELVHNYQLADLVVPATPAINSCNSDDVTNNTSMGNVSSSNDDSSSNSSSGTDWQQWQAKLVRVASPMDVCEASQQENPAVVAAAAAATPPTPA